MYIYIYIYIYFERHYISNDFLLTRELLWGSGSPCSLLRRGRKTYLRNLISSEFRQTSSEFRQISSEFRHVCYSEGVAEIQLSLSLSLYIYIHNMYNYIYIYIYMHYDLFPFCSPAPYRSEGATSAERLLSRISCQGGSGRLPKDAWVAEARRSRKPSMVSGSWRSSMQRSSDVCTARARTFTTSVNISETLWSEGRREGANRNAPLLRLWLLLGLLSFSLSLLFYYYHY